MRDGSLNHLEQKLLGYIVERGPVVTDDLCRFLGWSKPRTAGLLGGLVKAGVVERIDQGRKPALFRAM